MKHSCTYDDCPLEATTVYVEEVLHAPFFEKRLLCPAHYARVRDTVSLIPFGHSRGFRPPPKGAPLKLPPAPRKKRKRAKKRKSRHGRGHRAPAKPRLTEQELHAIEKLHDFK